MWLNCELNSGADVVSVSLSMNCSIRFAVLSKSVDRVLISRSVCLSWSSVLVFGSSCPLVLSLMLGIKMLWCLSCILRRVARVRECVSGDLCVPVIGGEIERGRRRERVLVVSSRRRVVRFLYLLFDDALRPSAYGTCCGLGWLVLAIPAHELFIARVGIRCAVGGVGDGVALAAADSSWLAWFGGGRGLHVGGVFVLFLRRIKLATR